MCNLFDRQHLKSDDQDVGGTQNEDNIDVYTCLFESLLFSYPNVLRDIGVVHAVLQLQQSYPNKKTAQAVHLMYNRCLRVDNLIILGAGTSL